MNGYDYTGKTVYVGIDVHKKTYSCACICDGQVVKKDSMPGKPEVILSYLNNTFSGAKIYTVYEAGFSGFHLHRYLVSQGINNGVVHPGLIEVSSRDRVKTDKRDALKMATQLSVGRLNGIYVPSQEKALIISHELSKILFNRDIKNVLLIHLNSFTAEMLDELLTNYEKQNVKFISLKNALSDPAYQINPNVVRERAYTFLNQIRLSRRLENPEIVENLYNTLPEDKLDQLCR